MSLTITIRIRAAQEQTTVNSWRRTGIRQIVALISLFSSYHHNHIPLDLLLSSFQTKCNTRERVASSSHCVSAADSSRKEVLNAIWGDEGEESKTQNIERQSLWTSSWLLKWLLFAFCCHTIPSPVFYIYVEGNLPFRLAGSLVWLELCSAGEDNHKPSWLLLADTVG